MMSRTVLCGSQAIDYSQALPGTSVCMVQVERATVQHAVDSVSKLAKLLWPHSRTVLFGSQATDLALPGSDLDIVILGVAQDLTTAASGFTK